MGREIHSWLPRRWIVVLLAAGLALLVPGLVTADDVEVTGNAIEIVGGSRTVTISSGGSATVEYYIQATGGDGEQGCNASVDSPAALTFYVGSTQLGSGTTPVAASPSSLTFTACKRGNDWNSQSVTFSSSTPGSHVITVQVSDNGSGSYNTSNATFTLVVQAPTPPDPTPPEITYTVTGTLGANGWYVSDVTVSWSVSDPESAVTSTSGCGTTTIDYDTTGVTLTCTATSAGGTSSVSVTIERDATPPQITCSPPDTSVWYGENVSVSCSASDTTSGPADSDDTSFTLSTNVNEGQETDGASTDSRRVCDQAGNCATAGPYTFKVDRKAPVVNCAPTTPATADGWYGDNVTVGCTASDGGSGLADPDNDGNFELSTDVRDGQETASAETGSRTVRDAVGNTTTVGPYTFQVDRKAPVVMLTCPAQPILQNTSDVFAGWTASDEGSGVDGATSGQIALDTSQVGTRTATLPAGSVRDRVGNQSAAASCNYSVIYRWSGFFRPVDNPHLWNVVNAGRAVPIKFSLAGFQGMDILSGSPRVVFVPCTNGVSDPVEDFASTSGNSGLQYDPLTDQYIYVWKTDRNWAGKCAEFELTLKDGTSHEAWFRFTR